VDGTTFLPVALPGHAAAQCGILVHDVCFAADAYFDPPVVDKHGVPYMVDYLATCRSADSLRSVQAAWFVPGHGEPARRPDAVIDYLKQRHEQAFQTVLAACRHPRSLDELLADVCRARNLAPANPGAYVLLRTPIAAYVTAAVGQGRMEIIMDGGKLQFLTIEK
jgi:glyoxylase-like metal-dependent hydrolase (beta-lactamase superfamily II)